MVVRCCSRNAYQSSVESELILTASEERSRSTTKRRSGMGRLLSHLVFNRLSNADRDCSQSLS